MQRLQDKVINEKTWHELTMQSPGFRQRNVLLLDPVPENTLKAFVDAGYSIHESFQTLTEGQLVKKIGEFQIVCLSRESSEAILTDEVLRSAHRLLAIGFFGQLQDQVDLKTAQSMGV